MMVVLILVLLFVFGGIGGYAGPRYGWGYPHYGGLGLLLLVIVLVLIVVGPWPAYRW